jgi:AraC family transcriptional regulator
MGVYIFFAPADLRLTTVSLTLAPKKIKSMIPRIITMQEKKLVGMHLTMSLSDNKTAELWKRFMPHRKEVNHQVSDDLFSMRVYEQDYFSVFNLSRNFIKWAAVEVTDFENVPQDMEVFILPSGLYAVFDYKGSSSDPGIFQHIYGTWLPGSLYMLDDRPHFEILGAKYKTNDPESEEEIWIPVKLTKPAPVPAAQPFSLLMLWIA